MKLATFYLSVKRPAKIIYHVLSTFRRLVYLLFVVAFKFIIQPVKFNKIIAATLAI